MIKHTETLTSSVADYSLTNNNIFYNFYLQLSNTNLEETKLFIIWLMKTVVRNSVVQRKSLSTSETKKSWLLFVLGAIRKRFPSCIFFFGTGSLILTIKIDLFDGHEGKQRVQFRIHYIMVMTWNELFLPLEKLFENLQNINSRSIKLVRFAFKLSTLLLIFISLINSARFKSPTTRP